MSYFETGKVGETTMAFEKIDYNFNQVIMRKFTVSCLSNLEPPKCSSLSSQHVCETRMMGWVVSSIDVTSDI